MDPEAIHIVSPQQTPEENLKPFSNLPKPKKPSLLIVILVLIAAIALATTFYFANQVNKLKKETQSPQPITTETLTPTSTPTPTKEPSPTPTIDPMADWKTYSDDTYVFKYPSDWTVKASDSPFLGKRVDILNQNQSVGLVVLTGTLPFGFGQIEVEEKRIIFTIEGIEIDAQETIVDNSLSYVSYYYQKGDSIFEILFGTGFPTTKVASLEDYQNQKDTILKILSTFQFLD